jgi:hypothetical protein
MFQGDLSKNAFREWLESNGILSTSIWEYDRVRPHFRSSNRLGYQLNVRKGNGKIVTIDVNSSMPPDNQDDRYLINHYDVKVTAGSDKYHLHDPSQLKSDIYVQIYVRPQPGIGAVDPATVRNALLVEEMDATRRILQISQAYTGNILTGFAWAKRTDVGRFKTKHMSMGERTTWSFWGRTYWRCPLKKCRPLPRVIPYLT